MKIVSRHFSRSQHTAYLANYLEGRGVIEVLDLWVNFSNMHPKLGMLSCSSVTLYQRASDSEMCEGPLL